MTFIAGLSDCRKRCRRKPEHELSCQGIVRAAVRNLLRPDFRFVVHRRQRKLFRPQRQRQGERDRQRRLRSLEKPLGPGNRNIPPTPHRAETDVISFILEGHLCSIAVEVV